MDTTPNSKDLVIIQRSDTNNGYLETHISGSNLILYVDNNGHINADYSASFYSLFPATTSSLLKPSVITGSTAPVTLQGYYQINISGINYWSPYYSSP